jgi:hypothetical protein
LSRTHSGQTLPDLLDAQVKTLKVQGYQLQ